MDDDQGSSSNDGSIPEVPTNDPIDKILDRREELIALALEDDLSLLKKRPDSVSVSLHVDCDLGLVLGDIVDNCNATNDDEESDATLRGIIVASITKGSALAKLPDDTIQAGDILEAINGTPVPLCTDLEVFLNGINGFVSLVFRPKNFGLEETPLLRQSVFLQRKEESQPQSTVKENSENGEENEEDPIPEVTMCQTSEGYLRIETIQSSQAGVDACMSQGDLVVAVCGSHCLMSSPDDVSLLWQIKAETLPVFSLLTLASPTLNASWRKRLKRASITVGGGTLVGVGAAIMATPLHPLGHAMAIGGVGVLGLEYEGPRKLMNRFRRSNVDDKDASNKTEDSDDNLEVVTESPDQAEKQTTTTAKTDAPPTNGWLKRWQNRKSSDKKPPTTEAEPSAAPPPAQRWLSRWRQSANNNSNGKDAAKPESVEIAGSDAVPTEPSQ